MLFSLVFIVFQVFLAPNCDRLLVVGDSVRGLGKLEEAKRNYQLSTEKCPENSAGFWRLSRSFLELADDEYNKTGSGLSDNEKLIQYRIGLQLSMKAIQLNKKDGRAWEMASTSYAAIINVSSLKMKAMLADSIRVYAEESARLDPTNDTPWHILGRWHYEVARLNWLLKFFSQFFFGGAPVGDLHKSERYFRKCVEAVNAPVNRYWLALVLEAEGKVFEAKKEYETIQTMKGMNVYHNDAQFIEKARKKLNQ